jgi:hypothetical protein
VAGLVKGRTRRRERVAQHDACKALLLVTPCGRAWKTGAAVRRRKAYWQTPLLPSGGAAPGWMHWPLTH